MVVFSDGTYLELFSWTGTPPITNFWADRSHGLIDFALTIPPPSNSEVLHQEIEARCQQNNKSRDVDFGYGAPEPGGRTRKDGVAIKWTLLKPVPSSGNSATDNRISLSGHRKDLPFFCLDITARHARVPFDDPQLVTHPCGATGIAAIEVSCPTAQYESCVMNYETLLGLKGRADSDGPSHEFPLAPIVKGSKPSKIQLSADQQPGPNHEQSQRIPGITGIHLHKGDSDGLGRKALSPEDAVAKVDLV